jgi:hypothetical protein
MRPRTSLGTRLAVISVVLGLAVACSVDVDVAGKACPCGSGFVCDTPRNVCVTPEQLVVAPSNCGDACPCTIDLDCKDPERPRCSPGKTCVECTRTPDTCPAGSYCNDLSQCTLGCKQESDCQISPTVPHCESTRHQCVECVTTAQCTGGKTCSPSGACVESCNPPGQPCTKGQCCGGLCLDTVADPLNCGGCGVACVNKNGTPKCAASVCSWTCASGFTHCDSGNTGCETNTRSDTAHCGSCSKRCDNLNANGVTCTAGACTFTTCAAGFGDCDGNKANGCECQCGRAKGQACCPGNTCSPGLTCNGASGKCN